MIKITYKQILQLKTHKYQLCFLTQFSRSAYGSGFSSLYQICILCLLLSETHHEDENHSSSIPKGYGKYKQQPV